MRAGPANYPDLANRLKNATLRYYLTSISSEAPAGPLSVWHSQNDNDLDPLAADFEDASYLDTQEDLIQPTDAPRQYYEVDVTEWVRADLASDGVSPLSAFRLQVDEAQFLEDDISHRYGVATNALQSSRPFLVLTTFLTSGDFDKSGVLDAADIDQLAAALRLGVYDRSLDVNGDTVLDAKDQTDWVHGLRHTWFGDADLNGEFNSNDFVQVFQEGKYETGQEDAGWAEGDWDASGTFDSSDFVVAFQDGGYELGPRTDAAAVPEPAAWTLLLIGSVLGLFGRRIRRGTRRTARGCAMER